MLRTSGTAKFNEISEAFRSAHRDAFLSPGQSDRFLQAIINPPPTGEVSMRDRMGPVRYQFGTDTCASFAVASLLEFYVPGFVPSISNIQHIAEKNFGDCIVGSHLEHVMQAVTTYGVVSEEAWPFDPQIVCYDPVAVVDVGPKARFTSWADVTSLSISYSGIKTKRDLVRLTLYNQTPVLLTVKFPIKQGSYLYNWDTGPYIDKPDLSLLATADEIGWHAVVITGYRDSSGVFEFKNSWGNWGDGGYGYMPYEYVDALTIGLFTARG